MMCLHLGDEMKINFELKDLLEASGRIIITTHMNPDGDGLGSELAMWRILKYLNKTPIILNTHPVPANYSFLQDYAPFNVFKKGDKIPDADTLIVLDISNWERLGDMAEPLRNMQAKKICIDHHPSNAGIGDLNYLNPDASSTGELVYEIAGLLDLKIDDAMGVGIYTAILTDTGAFKYSNTTPSVHRIAAQLIESGVCPPIIYEKIYEQKSVNRMKLLGKVLERLNSACEGRVVWSGVTLSMLESAGVKYEETEGFIDLLGFIGNVQVYLLFLEQKEGLVKISLRSKNSFDVNRFAIKFNGGGHSHAAGILMSGNIEMVEEKVVSSLLSDLECSSLDFGTCFRSANL